MIGTRTHQRKRQACALWPECLSAQALQEAAGEPAQVAIEFQLQQYCRCGVGREMGALANSIKVDGLESHCGEQPRFMRLQRWTFVLGAC